MSKMGLGKAEDLTGRVFGRLTVTGFAGRSKRDQTLWDCDCACGNVALGKVAGNLKNGNTNSCGCYRREKAVGDGTTHGMSGSPEYKVCHTMFARCSNPNSTSYPRYGGRGIKVCDEWCDFATFFADMGPRPSPEHSLERRENDGPYAPWNCFWATRLEQANNKSNNVLMTHLGETRTMAQWCKALGLSYSAIHQRKQQGWSDEDALTKPVRQNPAA